MNGVYIIEEGLIAPGIWYDDGFEFAATVSFIALCGSSHFSFTILRSMRGRFEIKVLVYFIRRESTGESDN